MSKLVEGAKKLISRKSELGDQVNGLAELIAAGEGRLPADDLAAAQTVVDRVTSRLRLSADHTVVALAGATGSGKSSTFNAISGVEIATVGVRRPTTSWASSCVWGKDDADEVLDWLEIPERHRNHRESTLDAKVVQTDLDGLVLLDLPDHDSTEVAHHLEVDRLILLADVMVWVLDPQKYADAALHDRFLRPLAAQQEVMLVVLNHIDEVAPEQREPMLRDVERLLAADGLSKVPVLGISALTGEGVDKLRKLISDRISAKKTSRKRLQTDIQETAKQLAEVSGTAEPKDISKDARIELSDAVADAAGVPVIVDAVRRATKQRTNQLTGWPVTKWLSKLKPDPLKRLHLDLGKSGKDLISQARTSLPEPTKVQRARVDSAVRGLSDDITQNLTRPWRDAVQRVAGESSKSLGDKVDKALASTDLGVAKLPIWAQLIRVLQWLLFAALIGGLGWLLVIAAMKYLQLPPLPLPTLRVQLWQTFDLAYPTILVAVGLLGIPLALLSRFFIRMIANSKARSVDRKLRTAIHSVTKADLVAPINLELQAYRDAKAGLIKALR